MDKRVREAALKKIQEAIDSSEEAKSIAEALIGGDTRNPYDLTFGITIGRIYNSFHYQTRRILGRNETPEEFKEFVELLTSKTAEVSRAVHKSLQDKE